MQKEDEELLQLVNIVAVLIPQEGDEDTNEEVIDDDVFEDEMDVSNVADTYEAHTNVSHEFQETEEQALEKLQNQ